MMCRLDLSRLLSKWRVIANVAIILAAIVYPSISYAITHAECEEAKQILLTNLDGIDSGLSSISNVVVSVLDIVSSSCVYTKYVDSDGVEHPTTAYLTPLYDSSGNNIGTLGSVVVSPLNSTQQDIISLSERSASMRALLNSLQCDDTPSTNGCNCAAQLAVISQQISDIIGCVTTISNDLSNWLPSIYDIISTWGELWLEDSEFYRSQLSSYGSFFALYTNSLLNAFLSNSSFSSLPSTTVSDGQNYGSYNILHRNLSYIYGVQNTRRNGLSNLQNLILQYGQYIPTAIASLNRWANAHWLQLNAITNSLSYNPVAILLHDVDRSPLDRVSSDYFARLTNDYLSAWSANDNPNTNWFRRVEVLLAALVFRDSGHQEDLDEIEEGLPSSSDLSSLESALDAAEMFDVDLGRQFFDGAPSLPEFGSQLPQTLTITIPSFGGSDSSSASSAYNIDIDVNSISSICDAVRACFRFLWWGLVALLVFFLGRWLLRGCSLAFRLVQGIHFS